MGSFLNCHKEYIITNRESHEYLQKIVLTAIETFKNKIKYAQQTFIVAKHQYNQIKAFYVLIEIDFIFADFHELPLIVPDRSLTRQRVFRAC